jgi:hypothetical protein
MNMDTVFGIKSFLMWPLIKAFFVINRLNYFVWVTGSWSKIQSVEIGIPVTKYIIAFFDEFKTIIE